MKSLSLKKTHTIIIGILLLLSILISNISFVAAQPTTGGTAGSETGLVKCGVSRDCTICDIFILIRDVFNFALGILAALAVLSIVIGGIYVLTSAGNSGRVSEGYSIITNAVIGLLLVMASFLLFSFVLAALGFQTANFSAVLDFQDGQIFSVTCDNSSSFNDNGQNTGGGSTTAPPGSVGKCGSNRCADRYADAIKTGADQYGIDPKVIQALIDTENADGTNCNPNAVRNESNGSQSCGILQLNTRGVAADCGITCEQAKNVATAVSCAARELNRTNDYTICDAANRWNPNACSTSCTDIKYTYCTRAKSHYDFYSKCAATATPTPTP